MQKCLKRLIHSIYLVAVEKDPSQRELILFRIRFIYYCFIHTSVLLPECMHVYFMHVYFIYALEDQKMTPEIGFPVTGVTDGCELPCGCWEPNPSPLQEQEGILTTGPSHLSSLERPVFYSNQEGLDF